MINTDDPTLFNSTKVLLGVTTMLPKFSSATVNFIIKKIIIQ